MMNNTIAKPFKDYFTTNEPRPTLEEVKKFFPSLCIIDVGRCYEMTTARNHKSISLEFFEDNEIRIVLSKKRDFDWRAKQKIVHSHCQFMALKDSLLNFIFSDLRKSPELQKWRSCC